MCVAVALLVESDPSVASFAISAVAVVCNKASVASCGGREFRIDQHLCYGVVGKYDTPPRIHVGLTPVRKTPHIGSAFSASAKEKRPIPIPTTQATICGGDVHGRGIPVRINDKIDPDILQLRLHVVTVTTHRHFPVGPVFGHTMIVVIHFTRIIVELILDGRDHAVPATTTTNRVPQIIKADNDAIYCWIALTPNPLVFGVRWIDITPTRNRGRLGENRRFGGIVRLRGFRPFRWPESYKLTRR
mmetsp:Transcript_10129/g.11236  ORF Transcript_10129/g.11236 Transcript_10129/m.11236 type:complete len:245 (+) Transcript_10129:389-1123(+)